MKNSIVITTHILDAGADLKQIAIINHEEGKTWTQLVHSIFFLFFKMIKAYH